MRPLWLPIWLCLSSLAHAQTKDETVSFVFFEAEFGKIETPSIKKNVYMGRGISGAKTFILEEERFDPHGFRTTQVVTETENCIFEIKTETLYKESNEQRGANP